MFGLSKKERYERNVLECLYALFADIPGVADDEFIAPKVKLMYAEHWSNIVEEGAQLGTPAELTALIIAVLFYQDMIINKASDEDLETKRKCILEKIYDDEIRPVIMFKIELTTLIAGSWADYEIDGDKFTRAIRDIHRAIFDGDDEHLDDTVQYFINGANRIRAQVKSA